MKIGMIGLGRMGSNMVRRLLRAGHECVVYDHDPAAAAALASEGAAAANSLTDLVRQLPQPRILWIMVPAAAVDQVIADTAGQLAGGDIFIDGGNSHYRDDIERARRLGAKGLRYVDVGTSGGLWGLERGYCLMIGGEREAVRAIEPILAALAPGGAIAAAGTAVRGYLHVGPAGAGHYVKMIHNGIEYGLMAAYAEGFNLLHHTGAGAQSGAADAESAPQRAPQLQGYEFKIGEIAELWRHGSVISSWLLDLLAEQLAENAELSHFAGRVADSGEGRWTVQTAIDIGVPVPLLASALFARFSSRGESEFADRILSAMRLGFGGHHEIGGGPPK
ncbi:MAG: phosphogluconate dehydrogenase (NAD(+)-dependent, decarboxylating) [Steroidobacterales bacterium]